MKYKTLIDIEEIIFKEKGSKFLGFAYHVINEEDIKNKLAIIRQQYPKATHYCYAYRLGKDKNIYRANDDGEPNGTAGLPILHQIDSFGLTNTLIIIVRYFGGTKLGVSGLIVAYKQSAKETISSTEIIEKEILDNIEISLSHQEANQFYNVLNQNKIIYSTISNENGVIFRISIENEKKNIINKYIK